MSTQHRENIQKMIDALERRLHAMPVPGAPEVLVNADRARTLAEITELQVFLTDLQDGDGVL